MICKYDSILCIGYKMNLNEQKKDENFKWDTLISESLRSILRLIGHILGCRNMVMNLWKTSLVYKPRVAIRRLVLFMKN